MIDINIFSNGLKSPSQKSNSNCEYVKNKSVYYIEHIK
uniref:Uncharacterized protein n=1 Tax=viral metagenome TaxID=1070528 RepID=A0A6C0HCY2_9ZZZZ